MTLDDLPDLPALRQIAEALWSKNAALMVGAGFSRNCTLAAPTAQPPPLWRDLVNPMRLRLYPPEGKGAPDDPLRLAEEYRTLFGQAALDDLVREKICDEAWTPGELHTRLLELEWSDVLTTNYDTLLERAAREVNGRVYDVVHRASDLAHTQAPRIVKLHGTLNATDQFILAEEDYRTYPTRHAAFVNFARQSFLENELCLLGFSGDDPNFLQWSGWVRDHLGSSARRIYLIGVFDLSPAKRRYLEARNIAPIDFHPLVKDQEGAERQQSAAKMLIDYLENARPTPAHKWRPIHPPAANDVHDLRDKPERAAEIFRELLPTWRENRNAYRGWLIAPGEVRSRLASTLHSAPFLIEKNLSALTAPERAEVLFEISWIGAQSLQVTYPNRAKLMAEHADPSTSSLDRRRALTLAATILSSARQQRDWNLFGQWAQVIEAYAPEGDDARAHLNFERAIKAGDLLRFEEVEKLIPDIVGTDPTWALRRASLWADVERLDKAEQEIDLVLIDLRRRQRMERDSIWVASRLAWAEWWRIALSRGLRRKFIAWPDDFAQVEADPWDQLETFRGNIEQRIKKRREDAIPYRPKFNPGVFIDRSSGVQATQSDLVAQHELRQFQNLAGVPVRVGDMGVLQQALIDGFELDDERSLDDWTSVVAVCRSVEEDRLDALFGRVALARIAEADRLELFNRVYAAAGYWWKRLRAETGNRPRADERLAALLEILARLSVTMTPDQALKAHRFATEIGGKIGPGAFSTFKQIGVLAELSAQAIANQDEGAVINGALAFPTFVVKDAPPHFWPRASTWLFNVDPPAGYRPEATVVQALIERAEAGADDRSEAILRLAFLHRHQRLDTAQVTAFRDALWRHQDQEDPAAPDVPGMVLSPLLYLPAPDDCDISQIVRARLFAPQVLDDISNLTSLVNLGQAKRLHGDLVPTTSEARDLFDAFTAWQRPTYQSDLEASFEKSGDQRKAQLIAKAMALVIVPALSARDRTAGRFTKLCGFLDRNELEGAAQALVPFAQGSRLDDCVRRIRQAIQAPTSFAADGGISAVTQWRQSRPDEAPPTMLVEQVISTLERRRWRTMNALLWGARRLLQEGDLTDGQIDRVIDVLDGLSADTAYSAIALISLEASLVSLVRAQCVGLALDLLAAGHKHATLDRWVAIQKSDPLPEVRFALPINDSWRTQ